MADPRAPTGLVLFDGECNLCNGAVKFVVRRDPHARLRFAPLQSEAGRKALAEAGVKGPLGDSMVLLADGVVRSRSSACLHVAKRLRFPWPLLAVFLVVPRPIRDAVYAFVAKRRHKWFGRREECLVPTPELRARFLDGADRPAGGAGAPRVSG